jgi:hypothetical protein
MSFYLYLPETIKMSKIPNSDQSQNTSRNYKSEEQMDQHGRRIYWRWDQAPRRSKHPLSTGHTRREPSSIIVNVELSAVKVCMPSTV